MPRLSKIGAAALAAFGWTSGSSVTASYLVVAGGGAGGGPTGGHGGGGGGAGGYRTGTASLNPSLSYTVTVGAGAAGATGTGSAGSSSTFSVTTSAGGGGGGSGTSAGVAGGSGGGGASDGTPAAGGAGNTPSTSPSQGNNGGQGITDNASYSANGGGGGSGAVGAAGVNGQSGAGGAGTANTITGSSVTYAGGGGGGQTDQSALGAGGSGGGGSGGVLSTNGNPGTANLGGGGGGSGRSASVGGSGGSGVVIISYVGAQQFGGGNVTSSGGNTIHTFTTSGTLSPLSSLTASYLVVAGGAGGGYDVGGGGGAGGLLTSSGLTIDSNSTYLVTVGAGGAGAASSVNGTNGSSSAFSMVSTTAVGGGGGASAAGIAGSSGGSGGGGTRTSAAGGSGTSGQGSAGGSGSPSSGVNVSAAGGGGGAGAVGANSTNGVGGAGGIGVASSISGTSTYYAGGGGGRCDGSGVQGAGGSGGGGAAGSTGTAGTANLGGGGGGGSTGGGGAGGSGVVIISYPGSTQQMAGGTVTISGGNVIHTFTSSGYLTPIKYASRSLRFRSTNNSYLNRTPAKASNQKTWTWSGWVKRGNLATGAAQYVFTAHSGTPWGGIVFDTNNKIEVTFSAGVSGGTVTSAVYRDPSAWYHVVVAIDTTQATNTDRLKLYVNGVQVTSFASTNYPAQNFDTQFNSAIAHYLGCSSSSTENVDGYLTEVNFVDGAALTPSSFGTFNSYGVWQPITYGGSYGTNGFYLTFGNNTSTTTLGYDTSPQGNNWTANNISLTTGATYDSMLDVPTLTSATVANYCVYNPVSALNSAATYLTQANLYFYDNTNSGSWRTLKGTISMPIGSAKYYWEATITNPSGSIGNYVGIDGITDTTTPPSSNSYALYWSASNFGKAQNNGGVTNFSGTPANGDVLSIAYDAVTGKIWFGKNGTWFEGDPSAGTSASYTGITAETVPFGSTFSNTAATGHYVNFGQRPFSYTAPTGFVALNTYNLSTPTIPNGAVYMAATIWTGTGATLAISNAVNGTSFQPDFIWQKARSNAYSHKLYDSVRGITKQLNSDSTASETTTGSAFLTSIDSGGFTVGNDTGMNGSGSTFVGWQWKANGTGVSNTSGSITSTVSSNTTAGFSVVTYTGTGASGTVGHGLGVTPNMIIYKQRSQTSNWTVMHSSLPNMTSNDLFLNTTGALDTLTNAVPAPTSSTFGVSLSVAGSGQTCVAYVFAAVAGYSAFGSYTGNGSTDGPFVYTGFRPRWVMIKRTDAAGYHWGIWDTSVNTYNLEQLSLYADSSGSEINATDLAFDGLSNGFKIRGNSLGINASGGTYIYMAFAESPFKFANAR